MTRGTRAAAAIAAVGVFAGSMMGAAPARADGPVTISATGPASVPATVGRASATSWATFTIADASATATSLYVCYLSPDGKRRECDSVALTPATYGDGNPLVTGGAGSYQYQARIAYNSISKDECWAAHFAKQPYRITVSVRNPADVELASATHPYKVACTGIVAAATGPKRLVVYAGRSSAKAVLKYYLLDTAHRATSIRLCNYDGYTDTYFGCRRDRMPSKWRTDFGWAFNYTRNWGPMGFSACALIKRRWPSTGTKVEFYDDDLRKLTSIYRGFHLECG